MTVSVWRFMFVFSSVCTKYRASDFLVTVMNDVHLPGQTHVQIIKSKDVIDLFLEFQYDTKKRI